MPRARMMYSNFVNSNFEGALLYSADLTGSNIKGAVLKKADARHADLEKVNMRYVDAQHVNMRQARLKEAVLDGGDFSHADLTNAVMERVSAEKTNFEKATLESTKLEYANLKEAILNEIKAKGANLTEAVMREVDAYQADLSEAILQFVNAENAKMIACNFSEAKLQFMNVENAILNMCNMEKANCTKMKFNEETLLLDVNFKNAIGADGLKDLQQKQHELNSQLFGRSRYGACNKDEGADRFACQRLGAAVLSSVIGGTTGYAFSGPVAGMAGGVVAGLVSDRALVAIKDGYFKEQGYISNQLGDNLAELGAIAISTGAGSLEAGVNSIPVAAALCTATGLISPGSIAH